MAILSSTAKRLFLPKKGGNPEHPATKGDMDTNSRALENYINNGGVVNRIIAGTNITISPTSGTGVVTISASGSGGGYASLTGAGETTTPGDLTQAGGFTVDDNAGDGISLTSGGSSDDGDIEIRAESHSTTPGGVVNISAANGATQLSMNGGTSPAIELISNGLGSDPFGEVQLNNSFARLLFGESGVEYEIIMGGGAISINIGGVPVFQAESGFSNAIGFYNETPITKQSTPSTLTDVITILQNLGLCS
jgi:hypothetical protein